MKMITADYDDFIEGRSRKQSHAVSITLEGVEVDTSRDFQHSFPMHYGRVTGPFRRENRFWQNYHWRVFRARSDTARLLVSDWANDTEPGGPIGQALGYNFIEIQPYLQWE